MNPDFSTTLLGKDDIKFLIAGTAAGGGRGKTQVKKAEGCGSFWRMEKRIRYREYPKFFSPSYRPAIFKPVRQARRVGFTS
jgi:hypothetical protein